jgi:hypothetical protein
MVQAIQPATAVETTDPRIVRSRRMLMDSLAKLLTKKEFEDISVQEIADDFLSPLSGQERTAAGHVRRAIP